MSTTDRKLCKWCYYCIKSNRYRHTKCKGLHECECKSHYESNMYESSQYVKLNMTGPVMIVG